METAQYKTPYERYIRESIDEEKKNLDNLYNEFAKSNSINKQIVKRKIDITNQNIELLKQELEKYGVGLSWLREPSKDRDEKAEHLEKIQEEPQAKPATAAATSPAARPAVGTPRPSVGTPVGAPRPSIGTPKPQIGTPTGTRPAVGTPKPAVGTPVGTARPQVGTPVGTRPQVGTPVGTRPQVGTPKTEVKKDEKNDTEETSA
ncbi:MAG: hypothetical protein ACYCPW_08450 [Nitrososphaerales archaeon]